MLRLMGAIMVTGGAAALGLCRAAALGSHVKLLTRIIEALGYMKSEIQFALSPVPNMLSGLAKRDTGAVAAFFGGCRESMDKLGSRSFSEIWDEELDKTLAGALKDDEIQALRGLGALLGRYDASEQAAGLAALNERFGVYRTRAEEERARLGKLYGAMGVLCGAAAVIILI